MEGSFLAQTFSFLRSNDLVYGPAVRSYLMGKKPPRFDLLYWNGDSTNLPGKMALEYLNKFYKENQLSKGELVIMGERLSLKYIDIPIFVVATHTDHIAPWKSSFFGAFSLLDSHPPPKICWIRVSTSEWAKGRKWQRN